MSKRDAKEWRRLIRFMRKRHPIAQPVRVVRIRVVRDGDYALTTFNGRSYRLRIKSNQEYGGQVDSLLHEWAHIRAIEEAYAHKGRWSEIFGEIYDTWESEYKNHDETP